MYKLTDSQKNKLHVYGKKLSDKLTDLTHQAHHHKIIVHNKHEQPFLKFPLLLGIIATLILPVFVGLLIAALLVNEGNLIVEREEN